MIHTHSTYVDLVCAPATGKRSNRWEEGEGGMRGMASGRAAVGGGGGTVELLRGGRFAGGLGLGERCQVFQASLQVIKQINAKDIACSFREASSTKKWKGSRGGKGASRIHARMCVHV